MRGTDADAFEDTIDRSPSDATEAPSPGELAPGRVIGGRYQIVRRLGAGAMGAVYEARHLTVDRRVAVKVLHGGVAHDATVLQRFMAEARAAGRARHRHIVDVLDFGADGPMHWMVLEYLDGEALEDLIEREAPLSPARVAELLDPLLRAVSHAHGLGFIHRDLKPANLFLAREPGADAVVPKVLDFGIAKNTGAAVRMTSTETIVGTPAYMAPEQVESARDVTPAADQYALGCVAYEMFTGRLPIQGETLHGMLVNKVIGEALPLGEARPDLAPALCECVMRALERDPAKRFADTESFRVALVEACGGAPVAPAPAPSPVAAPEAPRVSAVVPPAVLTAAPPAPSPSRRGRLAIVALAAAVALGVTALVTRRSGPPEAVARPSPELPVTRVQPERSEPSPAAPPAPRELAASPLPEPVVATPDTSPLVAQARDGGAPRALHPRRRDRTSEREAQGHRLAIDPSNPL